MSDPACTCETAPVVDRFGRLYGFQVVQLDLACRYHLPHSTTYETKD